MLFHSLACGWVQARQAAGRPAEETIGQILNWMKKDDYGFCNGIERDLIKVLDAQGQQLFIGHSRDRGVERQRREDSAFPLELVSEGGWRLAEVRVVLIPLLGHGCAFAFSIQAERFQALRASSHGDGSPRQC